MQAVLRLSCWVHGAQQNSTAADGSGSCWLGGWMFTLTVLVFADCTLHGAWTTVTHCISNWEALMGVLH